MSESVPSFVAIAHDFTRHPKVLRLGSVKERWVWLELLCYSVEYRTDGEIPGEVGEVIKGATPAFLEKCEKVGLLDRNGGLGSGLGLRIHDFEEFNGSKRERLLARERKRRQRELDRDEGVTFGSRSGHDDVTPSRAADNSTTTTRRESLRTNEEPARLSEADVVAAKEARERSGWVDNLSSYTGCRYVRGTHGQTAVADILGTEPPPAGWEHSRPTRAEVAAALAERQSA